MPPGRSLFRPLGTASASPFTALQSTTIETQAAGIEKVQRRVRRGNRRTRGRRGNNFNAGAAAAIGVGALIVGAALAANAAPRRCRIVRVERWSRRHQAYVIRRKEVCN
ncbi:MAG: hypothetical protein AcusKO_08510 [Acuticoccus sp.]